MLRILSRKARNSLSYRMCKRWDTPDKMVEGRPESFEEAVQEEKQRGLSLREVLEKRGFQEEVLEDSPSCHHRYAFLEKSPANFFVFHCIYCLRIVHKPEGATAAAP
jgi:hypothetical protein